MEWQDRVVSERRRRSVEHIKKYREVEKVNNQLKEDSKYGKVDGDRDRDTKGADDP